MADMHGGGAGVATLARRDRYGELVEDPDDDGVRQADPVRCDRGKLIAADGTCCLRHDRDPVRRIAALQRR